MQYPGKIWQGNTTFEEPICFSADGNGKPIGGTLLYAPVSILSITSYDRKVHYVEGEDYILEGRNICRLPNSRIPFLSRDTYCKPYLGDPQTDWVRLSGGKDYMAVVDQVYKYQVLVTYTHNTIWQGEIPRADFQKFPQFRKKLQSGENVNLVFYGDSITAGWEASGANEDAIDMVTLKPYPVSIQHPPYLPAWAELVTAVLRKHYPTAHIQKYNRAAGGSTTEWGVLHAEKLVCPCQPDLVILAFGMNSMQEDPALYREKMASIIKTVRTSSPDCAFLLVSSMIPNPEIAGFQNNQLRNHEQVLRDIGLEDPNTDIAPVHSVFCQLETIGKQYLELTGNCINHPNDFSVQIYAQTVLSVLLPESSPV